MPNRINTLLLFVLLAAGLISCGTGTPTNNSKTEPTTTTGNPNNTNLYGIRSEPSVAEQPTPEESSLMDECLIGEWVTVSIQRSGYDEPPDSGAGVVVTFDRDGRMTVDHSSMSPMIEYMGYNPKRIAKTTIYSGKSVTYIQTRPDKWVGAKNDYWESTVTIREVDFKGELWEAKLDAHGPGAVSLGPYYVCTQDTLSSTVGRYHYTLKRVS
jgi:hypothetical protein